MAKRILVLVGTKKALGYAVRNMTVSKRNTMLKERLQQALEGNDPNACHADRSSASGR